MTKEQLEEILHGGEGQSVEFKTSLAEQREAVQTLVAFANGQGGKVLIGVKNDGTPLGVDIGRNTVENLASDIKARTYPSLPITIELFDYDGKQILIAECPNDVPPIVGVYLYSSQSILPDRPVDAAGLQAYRRVGRTNQKVDFMSLRAPLPSDPNVVIRLDGAGGSAGTSFPERQGFYYSNNGQGWAYNVTFDADHPAYKLDTGPRGISLPPPDEEKAQFREHPRQGEVSVLNPGESPGNTVPVLLRATYKDENGLTWQSALELIPTRRAGERQLYDFVQGRFWRKIIKFPPKTGD